MQSTGESGWVPCWPSSGLLRAGGNFEIEEELLLIYASSALRTLNDMDTIFPWFLPRLPRMLLLWLLPGGGKHSPEFGSRCAAKAFKKP